jgi:hypothetical protein
VTGPDQGFLVSPLVLIRKPWERGWDIIYISEAHVCNKDQNLFVGLCYVMLCYVMLCYVMLCYAMLCYAMLCYVMLYVICYMLYVICYMLYVICYMLYVICYMLYVMLCQLDARIEDYNHILEAKRKNYR